MIMGRETSFKASQSSLAPCVLKPITGFGGLGVQLIQREFDLDNIYDYLKFHSQMFGKGAYLLQEYVKSPGYDIRALVLDGEVITTKSVEFSIIPRLIKVCIN